MHDPIYRKLFSSKRMVADLVRAVGDPGWTADVDFEALEQLPAEYVGDRLQQRRGDAVWRVPFRGAWLYLLLLLEFQSEKDPLMPLRNLEYTALLYGALASRDELGPPGAWPPVLPVVLYNGDTPWADALEMRDLFGPLPASLAPYLPSQRSLVLDERRVAADDLPHGNLMRGVVGIEQSRSPDDLARAMDTVQGWLRNPEDGRLGRVFGEWLSATARRAGIELPGTLKEATMTLEERAAQWPEQWRRKGLAEGRREGVAEGRREGVAEGRREGVAEGRREGLARERALLRRQATVRFGDAVGARIDALIGDDGGARPSCRGRRADRPRRNRPRTGRRRAGPPSADRLTATPSASQRARTSPPAI